MILCIGTTPSLARSMIFDRIQVNEANRAREVIDYASGKAINAARVVHTLGKPVTVAGFVGGERGKSLCADLDRAGIAHAFTEVQAQTRFCITSIDRFGGTATEFIEESQPVGEEAWQQLSAQLDQIRQSAQVVVCSGSLPPNGPTDFYAQQVQRKRPGQHIIIDGRGAVVQEALRQDGFVL